MPDSPISNSLEQKLAKLKLSFVADLPERIASIESDVLGITKRGEEGYQELYRKVHSLKGSGGTYGLQILTTICHHLESSITASKDSLELVSVTCLPYVDLLRQVHKLASNEQTDFSWVESRLVELTTTPAASTATQLKRCLIVEESKVVADLYKQVVSICQFSGEVVGSGYVALGMLLNERFDLLICGLQIGTLNGGALISALKLSSGASKLAKCVLIESNLNTTAVEGIDCRIQKTNNTPFALKEYLNTLI